MKIKIFDGKKVAIRPFAKNDLRRAKMFQDFVNSLVEEDAMISENRKLTKKEEAKWLKDRLDQIKNHKVVFLIAEHKSALVGSAEIGLRRGREDHVGILGISTRRDYRRIGLGKYLMKEIIKLAKKELRPKPKIIRLSVFPTNKPAIKLYQKFGFKKTAVIHDQLKYKGKLYDEIIMLLYLFPKIK